MFGVSLWELTALGVVALLVLGPQKLPGMLRTVGVWLGKLRRLTTEVRAQSGIDDALRQEGLDGGLSELRSIMRGGLRAPVMSTLARASTRPSSPAATSVARNGAPFKPDPSREYPLEGPDCFDALPEDLVPSAPTQPASEPGSAAQPQSASTTSDVPGSAAQPQPASTTSDVPATKPVSVIPRPSPSQRPPKKDESQ